MRNMDFLKKNLKAVLESRISQKYMIKVEYFHGSKLKVGSCHTLRLFITIFAFVLK